jgi:hypothetical protein
MCVGMLVLLLGMRGQVLVPYVLAYLYYCTICVCGLKLLVLVQYVLAYACTICVGMRVLLLAMRFIMC